MKISLEINNKIFCQGIQEEKIVDVIRETMMIASGDAAKNKEVSVSMAIVSEDEIRELNRIYRKKDKATDILSFANYESAEKIRSEKRDEFFLGEIIVCCKYIEKYAKIRNVDFFEEVMYIVSHGILHLLNFSHGEEMYSIQEKALNKIKK